MEVRCSYSELVDTESLVENPKNPNKHPEKQVQLLAKIMRHQGIRSPIVVSKRSGFVVKGHGRLAAIKFNNWDKTPVDYQDYDSEAQEYADMVADNKIAELSKTDDKMVLGELSAMQSFDYDYLGIPDFEPKEAAEKKKPKKRLECPKCGEIF